MLPERPPPRSIDGGRYEILDELGRGGIATVYLAFDHVLGVERAVKLLSDNAGRSQVFRSRFHTEARTMARLEHPNVLRVYDFGMENGRHWLVMELVETGSALELFRRPDPVPVSKSLHISFDVLKALVAVHDASAVHRDVKPGNILLARDGTARLSDFGIVRILNRSLLHQTASGDTMGTVGYMAPEQREDATAVTARSDIYSVGATLFALVTRRHPTVLEALDRRPEFLDGVPDPVVRIIKKATRTKPDERYGSARDMALAVVRAYDEVEGTEDVGPREHWWMQELDRAAEASKQKMAAASATVESSRRVREPPKAKPVSKVPDLPEITPDMTPPRREETTASIVDTVGGPARPWIAGVLVLLSLAIVLLGAALMS